MLSANRFERLLERALLPVVQAEPSLDQASKGDDGPIVSVDDFRRVVAVVALTAVGFFLPSLVVADVPGSLWLPFIVAAASAGLLIGGSFYVFGPGSRWAVPAALVNVAVIGTLAVLYGSYYHQLGLLFALIVAAHAIVHGIVPALAAAALGAFVIPYVVQSGQPINPSDPAYAFIYLAGGALIPWTAGRLARRRAAALRRQLAATVATEREAVMILARAAEAKDQVTGDHIVRVGDVAATLALRTGMSADAAEDLRFASMLHDVGKLHLPDRVLQKAGRLTRAEWELVKQHTIWGERILGQTEGFELARRICRWHHENFDGSGYPDGLRGEAIPLEARIVRIADVLDALRHERPYKEPWQLAQALAEIERGAGRLFDPELTTELLAMFDQPAATLRYARQPHTRRASATAHA